MEAAHKTQEIPSPPLQEPALDVVSEQLALPGANRPSAGF